MFNYLTLFSALFISGVAIYYSVAGLAAIFAASVIPVIIMGTSLEVGKLVVAVWLHKNWNNAVWWLKYYLSAAVLILMFITSMGIFGYLSKSHVEQTAASSESQAQIERIESNIARQKAVIVRSNEKINGYETNGSTVDSSIQAQIDKEQERINNAYKRIQPQVDQQMSTIKREDEKLEKELQPYKDQMYAITKVLEDLQNAINNGEIRKAQGIVGTNTDGAYGPDTARKVELFRTKQKEKIAKLLEESKQIRLRPNTAKEQAQASIVKINKSVQREIEKSNELIERLRLKIGQSQQTDIEGLILAEQNKIKQANVELDKLLENKFQIDADYRKLEAEVGPIKYIAEFIYNDEADKNLLEEAVRWVIVVIIFVFDPLAVLLLIASQYSFEEAQRRKKENESNKEKIAYEEELQQLTREMKNKSEDINKLEKIIAETKTEIEQPTDDTPTEEMIQEAIEKALHKSIEETDSSFGIDNSEDGDIFSDPDFQDEQTTIAEEYLKGEVKKAIKKKHANSGERVVLNRVSDGYISFNGKTYQQDALISSHPELELDLKAPIEHGKNYPVDPEEGKLYIKSDLLPTKLMRFNGKNWDSVDKNILSTSAYSDAYINELIYKIASSEYNPELLNENEKARIEELLADEV
jgi:biopolymer transport protein ExbB/TolQ